MNLFNRQIQMYINVTLQFFLRDNSRFYCVTAKNILGSHAITKCFVENNFSSTPIKRSLKGG